MDCNHPRLGLSGPPGLAQARALQFLCKRRLFRAVAKVQGCAGGNEIISPARDGCSDCAMHMSQFGPVASQEWQLRIKSGRCRMAVPCSNCYESNFPATIICTGCQ